MKNLVSGFSLVILLILSFPIYADTFQIIDTSTRRAVPYAEVFVERQFVGYTDMYGRIKVTRNPGNYSGSVRIRNERKAFNFTIDNSSQLKTVQIQ